MGHQLKAGAVRVTRPNTDLGTCGLGLANGLLARPIQHRGASGTVLKPHKAAAGGARSSLKDGEATGCAVPGSPVSAGHSIEPDSS